MSRPVSITAGDLRERVTLQSVSTSRNAIGGLVEEWDDVDTIWARIEPMGAGEQWRRLQMNAQANWKITTRYRTDVTPQMRFEWQGKTFLIRGITSADERKRFLTFACEELIYVHPTTDEEEEGVSEFSLDFSVAGNSMYLGQLV